MMRDMNRSLGWKKDVYDPSMPTARHLFGQARRGGYWSERPSLMEFRGPVIEQLDVNSCVGFAFARAVRMSLAIQGGQIEPPVPAPMYFYFNARRQEHAGVDPEQAPPVQDVGCYPALAAKAAQTMGFIPWDAWPYHPTARNTPPTPDMIVSAYPQRELAIHRVEDTGTTRIDAVILALQMGHPVIFGAQVDEDFMGHVGDGIITSLSSSPIAGGHMMVVLEYDAARHAFKIDNWWSEFWGIPGEGTAWLDATLFGNGTDDVYIVTAAPVFAM